MSIVGSDVWSALMALGLFLLVGAAVVGAAALVARRRGTRIAVVDLALTLSAYMVVLLTIGLVTNVVQTMTSTEVLVSGLPLDLRWPAGDPSTFAAGDSPQVVNAYGTTTSASFAGLSAGVRAVITLGQSLGMIVVILPAAAIAVMSFEMLRGRPFTRIAVRMLVAASITVLVAGLGSEIATDAGRALAMAEVQITAGVPFATPHYDLPYWPIGAALALAALAVVFRAGGRLQRDTEGLV